MRSVVEGGVCECPSVSLTVVSLDTSPVNGEEPFDIFDRETRGT
jgi:hypothetical protein